LFLSSGIEGLLEGLGADAAVGGEEFLTFRTLQIGVENLLDGIRHILAGKTRSEDGSDGGTLGGGATERDLVEFLALLIEAEDADVADMVMPAGIDAARDVDLDVADLSCSRSNVGKTAR
jgi:hypothetical protein